MRRLEAMHASLSNELAWEQRAHQALQSEHKALQAALLEAEERHSEYVARAEADATAAAVALRAETLRAERAERQCSELESRVAHIKLAWAEGEEQLTALCEQRQASFGESLSDATRVARRVASTACGAPPSPTPLVRSPLAVPHEGSSPVATTTPLLSPSSLPLPPLPSPPPAPADRDEEGRETEEAGSETGQVGDGGRERGDAAVAVAGREAVEDENEQPIPVELEVHDDDDAQPVTTMLATTSRSASASTAPTSPYTTLSSSPYHHHPIHVHVSPFTTPCDVPPHPASPCLALTPLGQVVEQVALHPAAPPLARPARVDHPLVAVLFVRLDLHQPLAVLVDLCPSLWSTLARRVCRRHRLQR